MNFFLENLISVRNFTRQFLLSAIILLSVKSIAQCPVAPSPVTASTYSFCGTGGNTNLNGTSAGNTIDWYTVSSGGIKIGSSLSGVDFSVTAVTTTTYYAEVMSVSSSTFNYSGGVQSFTVPNGVTTLSVDVRGAKGGSGYPAVSRGGYGGRVTGTISVTAGQVLTIYVGGIGGNASASAGGTAGYNGGGQGALYAGSYGGGGGGGASDIRVSPYSSSDRLVVAGGGGGGAYNSSTTDYDRGGAGGGTTAESGYSNGVSATGAGGYGATTSSGGTGGFWSGYCTGSTGAFVIGGNAGTCTNSGGGGGGGYYGGGGGVWAGGGGGSNFLSGGSHTQGFQNGAGQVILTYNCASPRTPVVVNVFANPVITVNSGTITSGSSFTMTPGGGTSYTYLPAGPIVTPLTSASYTVTGTSVDGCTNTAVSTVSVQGAALNFDGTDDYVSVPANPLLTGLTAGFTMEAWINPSNVTTTGSIIRKTGDYNMYIASGKLHSEIWPISGNPATNFYTGTTTIPTGAWTHVAVVWNGTTCIQYVNGVADPVSGTTSNVSGSENLYLGRSSLFGNPYPGSMDEVRIWNRALCQSEIQNYRTCEIATTATGLVANYHFNQGTDGMNNTGVTGLVDASGNGNNGTLTNFAMNGSGSNWLAPGAVTTGMSCSTFTAPAVTVNPVSQTNVLCNGGSNGAASVSASGGTGFTYDWAPGNPSGDGSASVSGLAAGVWTCTVRNSCGGVNTQTFDITQPSVMAVNPVSQTNVLCNGGSNGAASVSASGGASGYTYNWTPGNPTGDGTASVTGLAVGNWTCAVTDANSCVKTATFTITEPGLLTANSTASSILCNGGISSVTVSATGGTGAYTGTGTFTAMAGTQTYTVTDANGCSATTSVTITEPALLTANANASSVLCNGGVSTITVTATDGTAPYTGVGTFTAIAGTQTYTVTDNNGCTTTTSVNVTEPAVLVANSTASSILCNGGISTITVTATDGTAPYAGVGTFTTMAGTQSYTVTDNNGCTATTSVTITEPGAITASLSYTLCQGQLVTVAASTYSIAGTYTDVIASQLNGCDSTITTDIGVNSLPTITANSGSVCSGQSFTIVPGGADTYTVSGGSDVVMPTVDATYTVTGTDVNGCENTAVSTVSVNVLPAIIATTNNTLLCTGETATLSVTGADTYTWSTSENTADIAVSPASTETYTVEGTDGNGCSNSATVTQDVSPCTGIASINATDPFINVYPNPNNGSFSLELSSDAKVVITNAFGQVIVNETMSSGKHEMDIHSQADGIYFIKVIENNKQHTLKVIKK